MLTESLRAVVNEALAPYGYCMIVAKNPADALKEAARSISGPVDAGRLGVWTKDHWEKVS